MNSYAKQVLKHFPDIDIIKENEELFDFFVGMLEKDQNKINSKDPKEFGEFLGYKIGMFADLLWKMEHLGWKKNNP